MPRDRRSKPPKYTFEQIKALWPLSDAPPLIAPPPVVASRPAPAAVASPRRRPKSPVPVPASPPSIAVPHAATPVDKRDGSYDPFARRWRTTVAIPKFAAEIIREESAEAGVPPIVFLSASIVHFVSLDMPTQRDLFIAVRERHLIEQEEWRVKLTEEDFLWDESSPSFYDSKPRGK